MIDLRRDIFCLFGNKKAPADPCTRHRVCGRLACLDQAFFFCFFRQLEMTMKMPMLMTAVMAPITKVSM